MSEVKWTNGKEEYTREEVSCMLEAQRAMIYNDTVRVINANCTARNEAGKPNQDENNLLYFIKNCREVNF